QDGLRERRRDTASTSTYPAVQQAMPKTPPDAFRKPDRNPRCSYPPPAAVPAPVPRRPEADRRQPADTTDRVSSRATGGARETPRLLSAASADCPSCRGTRE